MATNRIAPHMTPAQIKASLISKLREKGHSALADELANCRPSEVQAYLADFYRRHQAKLEAEARQ